MSFLVVTGIVTRYANYRENDRILTLFTQEMGRVDAKARGCRKAKSPLLACSQPFVFGVFQLYEAKDRYIVDQCEIRESFYPLREDIDRYSAGSVMLSLSLQAVQERQPNPELFSLLYHGLSFLCYGENSPVDLALCFTTRFLAAAGVGPSVTACARCGADLRPFSRLRFLAEAGGALCPACGAGEGVPVSSLTLEAMRRMLLLEDAGMGRVRLPDSVRRELFEVLESSCAALLDRECKPLSSLRALL